MEPKDATARDIIGLNDDFISEANTAVTFKLVRSAEDIHKEEGEFYPSFSHQIFGDEEKIFGYKNLKVTILYSAAHLNIYVGIKHDEVAPTRVPPNIERVIFEKYETEFATNLDEFENQLGREKSFKPCGTLLKSFKLAGHDSSSNFEVYHCTAQTPGWLSYHSRLQTFILWFIDAASYIVVDDHWKFFVLYEKYISPVSSEAQYAIVGFTTVYEYYAYPANIRPRISQMLILPPFQKKGLGAIFLHSIYEHYATVKEVLDITVEDPCNDFQMSRDFVDCCNCKNLPSFSKDNLKTGYTDDMANEARERFKINKKQARRVYEILRLLYTNDNDEEDFTAFRLCVKRRLNALFQVLPENHVGEVLDIFERHHPRICFTCEKEHNHSPYPDVVMICGENGSILTDSCCKPCASERCLDFWPYHNFGMKLSCAEEFVTRVSELNYHVLLLENIFHITLYTKPVVSLMEHMMQLSKDTNVGGTNNNRIKISRDVIVMKVFNHLAGVDGEKRKEKLKLMFAELLEEYSAVVERLKAHDGLPLAS